MNSKEFKLGYETAVYHIYHWLVMNNLDKKPYTKNIIIKINEQDFHNEFKTIYEVIK